MRQKLSKRRVKEEELFNLSMTLLGRWVKKISDVSDGCSR